MAKDKIFHVFTHSKAKKSHQLVLLHVADHSNKGGLAWPRPSTLARKTGLSRYWVIRCLSDLILVGELELLPEGSPHGGVAYRFPPCSMCQLSLQLPKGYCQLSCPEPVNSVDTEPINTTEPIFRKNDAKDQDTWLTPEQAVKIGLTPGSRLYRLATGELQPEE